MPFERCPHILNNNIIIKNNAVTPRVNYGNKRDNGFHEEEYCSSDHLILLRKSNKISGEESKVKKDACSW